MSGVKRRVMYFSKLLFKSYEKKFSLGKVAQIVGNVLFNIAAGDHFEFLPLKS